MNTFGNQVFEAKKGSAPFWQDKHAQPRVPAASWQPSPANKTAREEKKPHSTKRQTYHDMDARSISPALPAERTDLVNSACGAVPHQRADLQQCMPDRATGRLSEVGNTTAAPARGRTQRS